MKLWKNTQPSHIATALLLTGILVCLSAGSAAADTWTLGFGFGTSDLEQSEVDLEFRSDVRGAYYFNQRIAIEAQLARATGIFDATLDTLMVNAVLDLRPGKAFVPYVLAGAGVARMRDYQIFSNTPTVSSDGSAFQAALGARLYFGEDQRMGVQFELSSLLENTDILDRDHYTSLTAGMTWRLGK